MKLAFLILVVIMGVTVGQAPSVWAWDLVLPDSVTVRGPSINVGEIAVGSVPTAVKDLVLQSGRRPGTVDSISRRTILRQLVANGLAAGVCFKGAENCRIFVSGKEIPAADLTDEIRSAIQDLVPHARSGAPASWIEVQIPDIPIHLDDHPLISLKRSRPLKPGRNQVRVLIEVRGRIQEVPVGVVLHSFAEIAQVKKAIGRDVPLTADMFNWEWSDLAFEKGDPALNRDAVLGFNSARSLAPGDNLRSSDLKPTPLVRVGDPIELVIVRGTVSATVRAFARQAGCLGQTIPVRNELTGRLVNARVAGPGLVEWRN
ncbi:MAG: flagellar basal body P-ring formation chaperone FlgA [Gemmatimonadales bacterium]|nr:flagellar basal body P-ring formation chaperone FlgA [Gemmatimonadales bacterium]